jgi:putative PIN family toxin of toxin-antitoxin system
MRVCIDTNVLVQIFDSRAPFPEILDALISGRLTLLVSTNILLEYEEIVRREFGEARWRKVERLLRILEQLHGGIVQVSPKFRFGVVHDDDDDNKFTDCAIAGEAEFVVTYDRHFAPLRTEGYRTQPITPDEQRERFEQRFGQQNAAIV